MTAGDRYISNLVRGLAGGSPFLGPEALERARGRPFKARLGANENGFGPSPRAIEAMRAAVDENWMYADSENADLINAVAAHYGVSRANIVVGEGIDGLLGMAVRTFLNPGEAVVTSDGAYAMFNHHVACHAGQLLKVPYRDEKEDLGALAQTAARERAKIVYVSNPDNPMGTWWDAAALQTFETNLACDSMLFLDEAYCETAAPHTVPPIDVQNPRTIRFRTFSKAYGLAGARIGYAIAHEALIAAMEKVRNYYGVNRVAQKGALAAFCDQAYLQAVVDKISQARDRIAQTARENGLRSIPSAANFVTIDCGGDGAFARRVLDEVIARDVFIRMPAVPPLDRFIRVSVGPDHELDEFARVLPAALEAARGA